MGGGAGISIPPKDLRVECEHECHCIQVSECHCVEREHVTVSQRECVTASQRVTASHCVRPEAPALDPPFCALCRAVCGPRCRPAPSGWSLHPLLPLPPELSVCRAHSRHSYVLCAQGLSGGLCAVPTPSLHTICHYLCTPKKHFGNARTQIFLETRLLCVL